jgi:hypothetical protein
MKDSPGNGDFLRASRHKLDQPRLSQQGSEPHKRLLRALQHRGLWVSVLGVPGTNGDNSNFVACQ